MDIGLRRQVQLRYCVTVLSVRHTMTLLHAGWEMDNEAWIVELSDGSIAAFTTSHGGVYRTSREELADKLAETEKSAASIRKGLELLP